MSKEDTNKSIVGRWFTDFWGKTCNLKIVDELAAPPCFCSTTVLRLEDGKIAEEIGLDDGVTALKQLELIRAA